MNFPADILARRITEFQLAESADGQVLGAVGLQIAQKQGLIHSEAFNDFSVSDQLRPLIWERLQAVATNHGLLRLWTLEQAPFWNHCGLQKADVETLQKLPEAWQSLSGSWLTLKLREDVMEIISAEKEFALFMESEKQRTQRAIQQARFLKLIATLLAFGLLVLVALGAIYIFRKNPALLRR
jgi:hypothetical protein